jgi:hypothetical protein
MGAMPRVVSPVHRSTPASADCAPLDALMKAQTALNSSNRWFGLGEDLEGKLSGACVQRLAGTFK